MDTESIIPDRIQACADYFKQEYHRYQAMEQPYQSHTAWDGVKRVQITPFHEALCEGNFDFVMDTVKLLNDKPIIKFTLNALLDYRIKNQHHQPMILTEFDNCNTPEIKITNEEKQLEQTIQTQKRYRKLMLTSKKGLCTELPAALVAYSGNEYLLRALVQEGLELDAIDSRCNCILHELVKFSVLDATRALEGVDNVLHLLPNKNVRKRLFHMPNCQGIRPVELAAKMARPQMLQKYMNIDGVYRHTVDQCLMFKIVRYDVTDYESRDAKVYKSLLYHLTEADEDELNNFQQCGLLSKEPFNSWIQATFENEKGIIRSLIWFWLILYALTFYQILNFAANGDAFEPQAMAVQFMMASFVLIVEIVHTKNNLREMWYSVERVFKHGKVPVTFTFSYRAMQLLFCVSVLINVLSATIFCNSVKFVQITFVMVAFFGVLSILFFLQLKEGVGHLLIVIQKMLYETFLYSFMFGTFCMATASAFALMNPQIRNNCKNNENATTQTRKRNEDPVQFESFPNSLYETILLVLYIMPPSDIYFREMESPFLTQLFYIFLILFPGLMMVNFLIAIMTRRAEQIDVLKDNILKLEKLSLVLYMQERKKNKVVRWIYEKCHTVYQCLTCFHRCRKCTDKCTCCHNNRCCTFLRNYFFPKHSTLFQYMPDGKVYLEVVEVALN